jgi:hypothetical protein
LYENCKVRNLAGEIIFYCSTKRARWYLDRKLAHITVESPLEIQLDFETKGDGNKDDKFYLQFRKNLCVVCGTDEELTRHHVIPYAFRKFLPDNIKNHSYHDILLLCVQHHEEYEQHAYDLKIKLGEEYGAPLDGVYDKTSHIDKHKARGYARSLLKHADKIPAERTAYLLDHIKKTMNTDAPNLEEIANMPLEMDVKVQGEIIVSKLTNIDSFLRRWREHFIETMRPEFMPEHWEIDRGRR